MNNLSLNIINWLCAKISDPELLKWTGEFLHTLCAIDTSTSSDINKLRDAENKCFKVCRDYLMSMGINSIQMIPVNADIIMNDLDFTIPYYAGPLKDSPVQVYHGRNNMLVTTGTQEPFSKNKWILNAHIDTVSPHIPPFRNETKILSGRGTTDNKGGVIVALLVCRLLNDAVLKGIIPQIPPLNLLFVIDEESGGNGTLSALNHFEGDDDTRVVVLEPTNLIPFTANRGAIWFKLKISSRKKKSREDLFIAAAHIIKAISAAGKQIRSESNHPLFNSDDVQTCFGILDEYGKHPSSACTDFDIIVRSPKNGSENLDLHRDLLLSFEEAVQAGDIVHKTCPPTVEKIHNDKFLWKIVFKSIGGHMGSKNRDSDAILKAASTVSRMAHKRRLDFYLPGRPESLCLEGGQGFLPDTPIESVKERIILAAQAALKDFCSSYGLSDNDYFFSLTFNKLHNRAYCSENSLAAPLLSKAAAKLTGEKTVAPKGWQASCDARIFARKFKDVITFGAGHLEDAHQDDENIYLPDLLKAAAVIVCAILCSGGKKS